MDSGETGNDGRFGGPRDQPEERKWDEGFRAGRVSAREAGEGEKKIFRI